MIDIAQGGPELDRESQRWRIGKGLFENRLVRGLIKVGRTFLNISVSSSFRTPCKIDFRVVKAIHSWSGFLALSGCDHLCPFPILSLFPSPFAGQRCQNLSSTLHNSG